MLASEWLAENLMCRLRKRKDSNAEAKMRVFDPKSTGREFHELEMGELEKLFDLA